MKIDIHDNKSIIKALQNEDESVFEQIYRFYYPRLCAFCFQYSTTEYEEIVQETMIWLWEKRASLIADLTLKSLLFTIVKNKALNRISHNEVKRHVHQEIIEKYEPTFGDPDFYLANELIDLYNATLQAMPPDYRTAFQMNRNEHLTHKEIAAQLNVSPQTVNYRIGQALDILRKKLKDYLPLFL